MPAWGDGGPYHTRQAYRTVHRVPGHRPVDICARHSGDDVRDRTKQRTHAGTQPREGPCPSFPESLFTCPVGRFSSKALTTKLTSYKHRGQPLPAYHLGERYSHDPQGRNPYTGNCGPNADQRPKKETPPDITRLTYQYMPLFRPQKDISLP